MLKCIRHKIVCVGRPQTLSFLRVFANLQKQTISFITSLPVCPSVRLSVVGLHGTTRRLLDKFT
jgi:hypothetical protein